MSEVVEMKGEVIMFRVVILLLSVFFLFTGICGAGNYGFETTSDGIAESLLSPGKGSKTTKPEGWESVTPPESQPKTRSIKVLKKDEGGETWETVNVPEKRDGGFVNLKIEFAVNSFSIRPESFAVLNELGKALSDPRLQGRVFHVNGHTDSDGSEKYNVKLSMNRALAVKDYLVKKYAIPPARLKVFGFGESMPLEPNTSRENKQLNRRVEIVASGEAVAAPIEEKKNF